MDRKTAVSYTAAELSARGKQDIPSELVSGTHLIYNSPASLMFNSPGAEGYGVKRAGLSVPDSVMLLVAPGCCGRNTSLISAMPEYHNRFFYLMMDETDLVTGRHLTKIPEAIEEICSFLPKKPSAVMICITCVDALLGTDMERVCRKAEKAAGVRVRPCYMYALTREGRKPPMVHVRQSIYSMLEKRTRDPRAVNLLGYFAGLRPDSELYPLLHGAGIRCIREIGKCDSFEDYLAMAEANFNLILHPEARFAAEDLQQRLGIPSVELTRLYQIERIRRQYAAFGAAIGVSLEDSAYYEAAETEIERFRTKYGPVSFAIGEFLNANPFELAASLLQYGFRVSEIYAAPEPEHYVYVNRIASLSPETRIYSNLEPTMLYYAIGEGSADLTIGKDASYYHPDTPNVPWNSDIQPFGYSGVVSLFRELDQAMSRQEVRQ